MSNLIKEIKNEQKEKLQDAIEQRFEELKNSPDVVRLQLELDGFLKDPYNDSYYMDEEGMLCSFIDINLGDLALEELETIDEILSNLTDDCGFFQQDQYAQGPRDYQFHQCLGEPVIYNETPERNCYAIYSTELNLKINSVLSEEHGFALIEQAMRKVGVSENIVSTDYSGIPTILQSTVSKLTDSELSDLIDKIESGDE